VNNNTLTVGCLLLLLLLTCSEVTANSNSSSYTKLDYPSIIKKHKLIAVVINKENLHVFSFLGNKVYVYAHRYGYIYNTKHVENGMYFLGNDNKGITQIYYYDALINSVNKITEFSSSVISYDANDKFIIASVKSKRKKNGFAYSDVYLIHDNASQVMFSPDMQVSKIDLHPFNKEIAFNAKWIDHELEVTSEIGIYDFNSKRYVILTKSSGVDTTPVYSPEGESIAYLSARNIDGWAYDLKPRIIDLSTRNVGTLTLEPLDSCKSLKWDSDGVLYITLKKTKQIIERNGREGSNFNFSFGNIKAFDKIENHIVVIGSNLNKPEEIYLYIDNELKWGSSYNKSTKHGKAVRTTVESWSYDGNKLDGLLTFPDNYYEDKEYPLVVFVHGGPADNWTEKYVGYPYVVPIENLSARGFFIFRPNPRGSSGYGLEFRRSIINKWGDSDIRDIKSGIDFIIEEYKIEQNSISIAGWSYGGYLGAMAIARYPSLFKRAFLGAPITDLSSFMRTTIKKGLVESYMGNDENHLKRSSPTNYVSNVTSEVLLMHALNDLVVPYEQSLRYYNKLRDLVNVKINPSLTKSELQFGHLSQAPKHMSKLQSIVYNFLTQSSHIPHQNEWLVIIGSFKQCGRANIHASNMINNGIKSSVIYSNNYNNLTPNLCVVIAGSYDSLKRAKALSLKLDAAGVSNYVKKGYK
jgi:dipeptidyl aminopeptidase/acylaminoacyl peptidase